MYEVKQIEGKGLGIIAIKDISKGSLILKETPQMSHVDAIWPIPPNLEGRVDNKGVISSKPV